MLHKIPLKFLIGAVIFLFAVPLGIGLARGFGKKSGKQEPAQETSISDALLLNKNLKKVLNVHREIVLKFSKTDTSAAEEIWLVPNGMSIPNYMLRASREIERCKGKVHWMKEIKNGRALLKYEGEQGIYPLTEIRIDTLWLPNSSKLAVVLAAKEQNRILKNKPEILEKLNFNYNLLIPSSRPEFLEVGKKLNSNIIPWIPMESRWIIYTAEKENLIPLGITSEKELAKRLDKQLKKFDNANGFAAFYGEDFLIHRASVEVLEKVLHKRNLWFWDLTKSGTASLLSPDECIKKEIRCRKNNNLDIYEEFNEQVNKALKTARREGRAILLFEVTEKNIELLEKLPGMAEKQGTSLVNAEEVF